jgi:rare lipoprotein A
MTGARNVLLGLLALGAAGCASATPARAPVVPTAPAMVPPATEKAAPAPAFSQTGRASWYGEPHHGRRTANGERFDMNALTAAHPTLPFGTRLRVVNLDNDREVEVRVNDRGPSIPGRIIDLSYAAARALDAVAAGVVSVRLTVVVAD